MAYHRSAVNIQSEKKAQPPEYKAVQGEDVPIIQLPDNRGQLKVLLGEYHGKRSVIPNYLPQLMYHVQLNAKQSLSLPINSKWEYGLYTINGQITVDDEIIIPTKSVAALSDFSDTITLTNTSETTVDVMIFGGEPYREPIVFGGPFIMNSKDEINQAYADYRQGQYGDIDYNQVVL